MFATREPADPRLNAFVGEGCQDRLSKAALGPVILDRHDPAGLASRRGDRRRVDRLDRVEIDDAGRDPVGGEAVRGRDRLVEGDAGADQGEDVAGLDRTTLLPPIGNISSGP